MTAIKLIDFSGERPRIIPTALPDNAAQDAYNARLDDGGLTPIHLPVYTGADADGAGYKTIYRFGSDWLSWADEVHAVPGPIADDRLYLTGDGVPKMLVSGTTYDLAIDPPAVALTATLGGVGAGDVQTRLYVYTWVTGFGEESEPCPVSNQIDWKPGNTVTLSGFVAAPAGRNITLQRIYRSQTGQSGTQFYLIAERAAANTNYADTVAVDGFQEPLPSADWNTPPDDLEGLIAMPNGMLVGFVGRAIYFCEPYHLHAWPEKYILTVDSDVVGLAAINTTLFILTEGNPHIAVGSSPAVMQMAKSEANLPCINGRSIVDLGFAACYASNEGLVRATADGGFSYCTTALFDRDSWLLISPSTLIGAQHKGRYVAFYERLDGDDILDAGVLTIDVSAELPFLLRSSGRVTAAFFDVPRSALYILPFDGVEIDRMDDPVGLLATLYWRSKPFLLPADANFGAIRVDVSKGPTPAEVAASEALLAAIEASNVALIAAGSIGGDINAAEINAVAIGGDLLDFFPAALGQVTIGIFCDSVQQHTMTLTSTVKAARLPSGFSGRQWEVDVSGNLSLSSITIAETMDELGVTS